MSIISKMFMSTIYKGSDKDRQSTKFDKYQLGHRDLKTNHSQTIINKGFAQNEFLHI